MSYTAMLSLIHPTIHMANQTRDSMFSKIWEKTDKNIALSCERN